MPCLEASIAGHAVGEGAALTDLTMHKTALIKRDGRRIAYYDFAPDGQIPPARTEADSLTGDPLTKGPELRWNPLLGEWTIVAGYRMDRPQLPKQDTCPLCPGGAEIPTSFEIVSFDNRFPGFVRGAEKPDMPPTELYPVEAGRGVCEVLVYTEAHTGTFAELPTEVIYRLVHVWTDRTRDLALVPEVRCVYPFENKGREIGVTLDHPHGQIYAFPYIPPRIQRELDQTLAAERRGSCLFCDIIEREMHDDVRVVAQSDHFLAVIPFYARYPYEIHLYARRHGCTWLPGLSGDEQADLARMLKLITARYDNLFGFSFPYMMVMHQLPASDSACWHYHVEFYPPYRSAEKLKYLASVESGAGSFLMDEYPERTAPRLAALEPADVPMPVVRVR